MEKIFARQKTLPGNKRLISRLHKEFLQMNKKNNREKVLLRHFIKINFPYFYDLYTADVYQGLGVGAAAVVFFLFSFLTTYSHPHGS